MSRASWIYVGIISCGSLLVLLDFFLEKATINRTHLSGAVLLLIILPIFLRLTPFLAFLGTLLLFQMSLVTMDYARASGVNSASDWKRNARENQTATIIELIDRSTITVRGERIICSERFCAFHDGNTPTVISLEGVHSIKRGAPEEQPTTRRSDQSIPPPPNSLNEPPCR